MDSCCSRVVLLLHGSSLLNCSQFRASWRISPQVSCRGIHHLPHGQACHNFTGSCLSSPGGPSPSLQASFIKTTFLEPVGGSAPKFPALTSTLTPSMPSALPFSLSCPAQGAPVPAYRPVQPLLSQSQWVARPPSSRHSQAAQP